MWSPEITLTGQTQASKPPLEPPPPCSPRTAPHSPGTENGLVASMLRTMRIGLDASGKRGNGARGWPAAEKATSAKKTREDPDRQNPGKTRRNRRFIGTKVSSRETSCEAKGKRKTGKRPIGGSAADQGVRPTKLGRRKTSMPKIRIFRNSFEMALAAAVDGVAALQRAIQEFGKVRLVAAT